MSAASGVADNGRPINLSSYPLDRLSRYEAILWRQAGQILFALDALHRRKLQERAPFPYRQPHSHSFADLFECVTDESKILASQYLAPRWQ